MKKALLILIAVAAGVCGAAAQRQAETAPEARLLRFPTTNGTDVVFSYAGDLYRVPLAGGAAVRLTSHVGYEMFAHYSPDGRTIAFTGQYDGNTEVYTIPASGGEPVRMTWTATNARDDIGDRMGPNNIVTGWTPDGRRIVYRNRTGNGFDGKLWTVSVEGGMPERIALPEGGFNSYSPDGRLLAYNRTMREFRNWKYYEGGMADDVWIFDDKAGKVTNITENTAQDIIPMWIGERIYFCSDRDRTMNIFCYDTRTRQTEKITSFENYDVKFPTAWGNWIIFENGGYIWKMDVGDKLPHRIAITLAADNVYARDETKDGAKYVTAVSASPDGQRVAVTARGEVFDVPVAKGVTRNITRTPGAHERSAQWSPDGKYIAYISDRTGETELWLQSAEGGEPRQATRDGDTYLMGFEWAPDSKTIALVDRKNRLRLLDVASGAITTAVEDPYGVPWSGTMFSPDGKWLTYTRMADNRFSVVYVYNIAERREVAVTDRWYDSGSPMFSTDGRYLYFSSARDFSPTYGSTEWNHTYNNMNGLYAALLRADTPSPFMATDPRVNAPKEEAAKADDKTVRVDAEGLSDRIIRIPVQGNRPLYATATKVYYGGHGGVRVYDLKAQKDDEVAQGMMDVTPGSGKALFMSGGKYYVTDIPGGKAGLSQSVDMADMKIAVDYGQEWAQIFDEAWRAFRDGFYVENMHGVDWPAMKEKYGQMLPWVKNRLDLNYLIGEMIAELKVGHAYVNPGETLRAPRVETGLLGAEMVRERDGTFRIAHIIPGTSWDGRLRSPLTVPGLDVAEGDMITAIDGVATSTVKDIYELLAGKAGVLTELTLSRAGGQGRKVVVTPIADEEPLRHWNWVQENIRRVDAASGGRIGYIYIPDMGPDGLNEFAKHFYPQLDKEGLIIDDRANGGGNVSPMILERLAREPYRLTMNRHTKMVGTIPEATAVGPMVCLINKYSASDGDLFPWGFRALGLGKLIGTRTWGGIVGISGSLPFLDGTDLRVPFMTSYDLDGNWIIENHGIDPDIVIDNDPVREYRGEDQQLERAIEEVMRQLGDRKPLAPVPAPRVWNK